MQAYDIIMIAVLVAATVFGGMKGMARQLASILSVVVSYFVAFQFRGQLAQQISAEPPWNLFLAMLILYLGTSLVIWIVFRFVIDFIDRVKLKEFDHQVGALVGAAKGVLLCIIITLFAVTLLDDSQRKKVIDSYSGHYIAILLDQSHTIMPKEVHDVLHPYLHEVLEEEHDHTQHENAGLGPPDDDAAESQQPPTDEEHTAISGENPLR